MFRAMPVHAYSHQVNTYIHTLHIHICLQQGTSDQIDETEIESDIEEIEIEKEKSAPRKPRGDMPVCVHVCMYVCMYLCVHVCPQGILSVCVCVCVCT